MKTGLMTHSGVEEKRVVSPGEGLGSPIDVVVQRGLGKLSTVLVLDMFNMRGVLNFGVVYPGNADGD